MMREGTKTPEATEATRRHGQRVPAQRGAVESSRPNGQIAALRALQGSAGNAAVLRLLASTGGPASAAPLHLPGLPAGRTPTDELVPPASPGAAARTDQGPQGAVDVRPVRGSDASDDTTTAPAPTPTAVDSTPVTSPPAGSASALAPDWQAPRAAVDAPAPQPPSPATGQLAQLIIADGQQREAEVAAIADGHRAQVALRFGAARNSLAGLGTAVGLQVQSSLASRRDQVATTSRTVLASGQALLTSTVAAARTQVQQTRAGLDAVVRSATARLSAQVAGATDQVHGLVDRLSLPAVPGVGLVRSGVRALISGASGALTAALQRVNGLITSALQVGERALTALVSSAAQAAGSAVRRLAARTSDAVGAVFRALQSIGTRVVHGLRAALQRTVLPALSRAEQTLAADLTTARTQAITTLRNNRERHLQSLSAGPGRSGGAGGAAVLRQARQDSAAVVAVFRERSTGVVGQALQRLSAGTAALRSHLGQVLTRVTAAVGGRVAQALGRLREAGQQLGEFLRSLLSDLSAAVAGIVGFVRSAVDQPVAALAGFVSGAAARAARFFSGLVARVLSGRLSLPGWSELIGDPRSVGGPITKPRPPGGPIVLPALRLLALMLAAVGAIVLWVAPGLVSLVAAALLALGITVSPMVLLVIVGVVALALVAAALLLLYLLYRLLKPTPAPTPPCTITTRTVVTAPDGNPDTRTVVGVNEQVALTASVPVTWTTSAGTLTNVLGPTATWTAPATAVTSVITATPAGGSPCSVTMQVVAPGSRSLTNPVPHVYTAGRAGSGFLAKVTIMPTYVSFSRIEVREESVAAVATGYYDVVCRWHGIIHPVGTWLPVDATNSGIEDKVGSEAPDGTPAPFSRGEFLWSIPQSYQVPGGSGPIPYSVGHHLQEMVGVTGEESTSKEGASHARTP